MEKKKEYHKKEWSLSKNVKELNSPIFLVYLSLNSSNQEDFLRDRRQILF